METKIASYQEPGIRLQLVKIMDYGTEMGIFYQIRKNRKVISRFKWETPAKQKFNALIQQELLQTSIDYKDHKLYKITLGGKYYVEEKEITKNEYLNIVHNNIHNIGKEIKLGNTEDKRYVTMKEITYEEYKKI